MNKPVKIITQEQSQWTQLLHGVLGAGAEAGARAVQLEEEAVSSVWSLRKVFPNGRLMVYLRKKKCVHMCASVLSVSLHLYLCFWL